MFVWVWTEFIQIKKMFLYWIFVFAWTGLEDLWKYRHILFISLPSSLFPVPFQAVFMPAKSISWLLLMIFLSLEFTGVTNSAVIWENSSQLVSVHLHLHYYHCNLPSFSHFLSHSTCYQAMGFLSFGHTTLSILFRAWQLCSSICSCSPVIEMLWYGREEAACTLYRLLICPLLIQRLDHACLSS